MKRVICFAICFVSAVAMCISYALPHQTGLAESRYAMDYFRGGTQFDYEQVRVDYASVEEDYYQNPYKAPIFIPSLPNACTVEAGGNAIVYFDRLYDELIPNYIHKYIWGKFTYGTQNEAVDNMFIEMHKLMGTTSAGTTVSGFKRGLGSYATNKKRSVQITSATGNYYNTDLDFVKSALKQEKLAIIFLDTFSVTPSGALQLFDGYDLVSYYKYLGCHTMLIYGYWDRYYYDSQSKLIGRDTYFAVSTGINGVGWINITKFCQVDDIFIIDIV